MTRIWVGDFRIKEIQAAAEEVSHSTDINKYFYEDSSEVYWFTGTAINQFVAELSEEATVILMPGFNDCVNSCTWSAFDVNQIAADYVKSINDLVSQHSSINFYFCSVNPVDGDFPCDNYTDGNGKIPSQLLNDRITQFNTTVKESCTAQYIDSYSYLTSTGFSTEDGSRFSNATAKDLLSYLNTYTVSYSIPASFTPRITEDDAPIADEDGGDTSDVLAFWRGKNAEGFNPFYGLSGHLYGKYEGDTLPNCTAYAWGRFYEILGSEPALSLGNAEYWYGHDDGYERGNEPRLGAIACWQKGILGDDPLIEGGDGGHVAIVEQINADGSIVTSESGWQSKTYWWTTTRTNNDGNWEQGSNYSFQGFIYCPNITSSGTINAYVSKDQVISKNSYLTTDEMQTNAKYIWSYLGSRGWTLNAVAGMLGNMQTESSITPNRCEVSNTVTGPSGEHPTALDIEDYANRYLAQHGRFPGYGLVQWTGQWSNDLPYTWENQKYIYWCNERNLDPADIDSQLERIIWECANGIQFYATTDYNMTFEEFSKSTQSADYLARAFLKNYERPAKPNFEARGAQGTAWYDYLVGYTPVASAPTPTCIEGLKVNEITPTKVTASFFTNNGTVGLYELKDSLETLKNSDRLTIEGEDLLKIASFSCNDLIPNTKYEIYAEVSNETEGGAVSTSLPIITPQDFPKAISSITLSTTDEKLPYKNFELVTSTLSEPDWGYWSKNDHGYTIQLIVNGKIIEEKDKNYLAKTWKVNLSTEFKRFKCKIGDCIQIGVFAWTKDDSGQKIFKNENNRVSNPICSLKKPVKVYLDIN